MKEYGMLSNISRNSGVDAVMCFYSDNGKEVGRLIWGDGTLKFEGECDKSAKVLFDFFKVYLDGYIQGVIKE